MGLLITFVRCSDTSMLLDPKPFGLQIAWQYEKYVRPADGSAGPGTDPKPAPAANAGAGALPRGSFKRRGAKAESKGMHLLRDLLSALHILPCDNVRLSSRSTAPAPLELPS
jgi:hypothetical protein